MLALIIGMVWLGVTTDDLKKTLLVDLGISFLLSIFVLNWMYPKKVTSLLPFGSLMIRNLWGLIIWIVMFFLVSNIMLPYAKSYKLYPGKQKSASAKQIFYFT